MMRLNPTAHALYPAGLDEPDCPACATGWHTRCLHPDLADDGDGELVERCCDGLLIARRRRPLWTRGGRRWGCSPPWSGCPCC